MPQAKASEIQLDVVAQGRTHVHGPYDVDYGRQHYGAIVKDGAVFVSQGTDGRELGRHKKKSDAVVSVVEWAEENLTKESVERDYESYTAGGIPLRFQRRVISSSRTSVVAAYRDGARGWASTSWDGDGVCNICKHDDTEEGLLREQSMRLVRRAPAADLEDEGEEPEESPAPRI